MISSDILFAVTYNANYLHLIRGALHTQQIEM